MVDSHIQVLGIRIRGMEMERTKASLPIHTGLVDTCSLANTLSERGNRRLARSMVHSWVSKRAVGGSTLTAVAVRMTMLVAADEVVDPLGTFLLFAA